MGRPLLFEGNAKVLASQSVARVTGPALGGLLIQLVGTALTMLADVVSYAVSVGTLLAIRRDAPLAPRGTVRVAFLHSDRSGSG